MKMPRQRKLTYYVFVLVFISQILPVSFFTYLSVSHMGSELAEKFSEIKNQTEKSLETSLNVLKKLSRNHRKVVTKFLEERLETNERSLVSLKDLNRIQLRFGDRFLISVVKEGKVLKKNFPRESADEIETRILTVLRERKITRPLTKTVFVESKNRIGKKVVIMSFFPLREKNSFFVFTRKETIENELFDELTMIMNDLVDSSPLIDDLAFHFDSPERQESESVQVKAYQIGILKKDLKDSIFVEIKYDLAKERAEIFRKQAILIFFYFLILFLCLLISAFLSRFISKPLFQLIEDIQKVATESLAHPIREVRVEELTSLRKSVTSLVETIKVKLRRIQELNVKVIEAGEEERKKIARDLHDSIGQNLISIKLHCDLLVKKKGKEGDKGLENIVRLLGYTIEELRVIYTGLFPSILSDFGLKKALEWYLNAFVKSEVSYTFRTNLEGELDPKVSIHLYRITGELVSNMQKHSQGDSFSISIEKTKDSIDYAYQDNGVGRISHERTDKNSGFGLENVRIRVESLGGTLLVKEADNNGTEISFSIPMK